MTGTMSASVTVRLVINVRIVGVVLVLGVDRLPIDHKAILCFDIDGYPIIILTVTEALIVPVN